MGRMRSALCAYALQTIDPAEVLDRLDHTWAFRAGGDGHRAVRGVHDLLDEVRISVPGICHRDGGPGPAYRPGRGLPRPADRRAGNGPPADEDGAGAGGWGPVPYTDGLVERRERPIDDGIARLSAAVIATAPETGCALSWGLWAITFRTTTTWPCSCSAGRRSRPVIRVPVTKVPVNTAPVTMAPMASIDVPAGNRPARTCASARPGGTPGDDARGDRRDYDADVGELISAAAAGSPR